MDFREEVLPQFFPAAWLNDAPEILFSDFPSRIRVGYVVRKNGAYSYLLNQELLESGLTIEGVHASALVNLQKLSSGKIRIARVGGAAEGFISAEDNFAAARILLPTLRLEFASHLGHDFLATLPDRDQCFCWSQAQDVDRQLRHAAEAVEDFISEDYNLTPDILLVNPTTFRLFRKQDTDKVLVGSKIE